MHTRFSFDLVVFFNHVVAFCCFCWQRTLVCRVVLCCANKLLQTCFGVYNPILFVKNKCRCKSHFATTFCGVCFQQLCVFAFVNFVVFVALPLQLCTTRAICRQAGKKVYNSCAKISKCLLTFAQKNIKILLVKIWAKHAFATSNHRRMQ